jgi:hypothetical protein
MRFKIGTSTEAFYVCALESSILSHLQMYPTQRTGFDPDLLIDL